jgi:hypothetical protein
MSAPLTGAIGLGATLFGGFEQAKGAAQLGAAQQSMYNYQAGVAEINAKIAKQNEDYERNLGELQAQQYGMAARGRMGQILSAQASSGLDVNTGSAKSVRESAGLVAHMDLDQIRSNAAKAAYNYDVQSTQYENQAQLYRMGGENAAAAAKINVESSIIGTASSVATKWLQASNLGMFSLGGSSGGTGDVY